MKSVVFVIDLLLPNLNIGSQDLGELVLKTSLQLLASLNCAKHKQ